MAVIPNRFVLIEYVRRLEEAHIVLGQDPARVNMALKEKTGAWEEKLWLRAQQLDAERTLQMRIEQWHHRAKWLLLTITWLWFVLGVFSAMGLMQATALNFFYVLVSVLGLNVLMFMLTLWQNRRPVRPPNVWQQWLLQQHDPLEMQKLAEVYAEQSQRPEMKWVWGKISHQLWLASLGGLLLGMVVMLLVRQYTFNWQSTLLDSGSLGAVVSALAWLPKTLGINVPDMHTVARSEVLGDVVFSKQWANLLWSSLFFYGVLPRLVAWWICRQQSLKMVFELPLSLPYYQRLKRLWSSFVVDSAADYQADAARVPAMTAAPVLAQSVLVAAWETEPVNVAAWLKRPVNQTFAGVIDAREEQALLLERLQAEASTQLYLWVRIHSMPERGTMRRLNQYADHAQAGLIVCLWQEHADAERLQLWQQALNEQALAWQYPQGEAA